MKIELSALFAGLIALISAAGTLWRIRKDFKDDFKQQEQERRAQEEKRVENEKSQELRHADLKRSIESLGVSIETVNKTLESLNKDMRDTNAKVVRNASDISRINGEVKQIYKRLDWVMEVLKPILYHLKIPSPSISKLEEKEEDEESQR